MADDTVIELAEKLATYEVLNMNEILKCVKDPKWQAFRRSLKGLPTATKLRNLRRYKSNNPGRCTDVQVENYLNALRRGGQLPPKSRR